jgi:segregation and condensation protein A
MASTLMHIKVRMLLPREVDEKGEEIDPRADLVKALLEYKRYKEVSEELSFLESNQRKISFRGNFSADPIESPHEYQILLKNITVYDIARAFRKVIEGIKPEPVHQIRKINITLEEQINFIMSKIDEFTNLHFLTLVHGMKEKIRVVITFIAILELVKAHKIGLKESPNFNDFVIYKIENGKHI